MKTIFAGTTDFGIPTLEMLKRDFGLALVITQPDRPVGRKQELAPPPVKVWARANGIPCIQPERISDAEKEIQASGADVMVVAAYGQIIPQGVLSRPANGCVNLHTSLLPKYRGASPIQNAIMNGDPETGVTVMVMDEKMDHGPVLAQLKVPILDSDDFTSLHAKLAEDAAVLLAGTLPEFLAGRVTPQEQDHTAATIVNTIKRDDARLDWTRNAREIFNMTRALNPEPGTWTTLGKKSVKILKTEETKDAPVDLPGKIYGGGESGRDCLVKCGDYSLKLLTVQPEGKKPMSGTDFLNGLKGLETKIFV